jgi:hypothetical protein
MLSLNHLLLIRFLVVVCRIKAYDVLSNKHAI